MHILAKRHHLGIDCGGTKFGGIVLDGNWRRLAYHEVPTRKEWTTREMQTLLESFLNELLLRASITRKTVRSVGIGVPGPVDEHGIVQKIGNLPSLARVRFADLFPNVPTSVWNDAACSAYGESIAGALSESTQGVHLTLGTGVGGAVVSKSDARALFGLRHVTEVTHIEIGRTVMNIRAVASAARHEPYELEDFCSRKFFLRSTKRSIPELFEAWKTKERQARTLFDEYGRNVGALLASVESIFKPDTISLSGGCIHALPAFRDAMHQSFRKYRFLPGAPARIAVTTLAREGGAFGAALYGIAGVRKGDRRNRLS